MFKEWIQMMFFLWRQARYQHISSSQIVSKTKGHLVYAHLIGGAQAAGTASIYDGESTLEEKVTDMAAIAGGNDSFAPSFPTVIKKGIYIALAGSGATLTLVFMAKRE